MTPQERALARLRGLNPAGAPDTAAVVPDSLRQQPQQVQISRRGGAQPPMQGAGIARDSIVQALLTLRDYIATEYRGDTARYHADSARLELRGNPQVSREGNQLDAKELIVYDQDRAYACGYGSPVLRTPQMSNPVASDTICYYVERHVGRARGAETQVDQGASWFMRLDDMIFDANSNNVYSHGGRFVPDLAGDPGRHVMIAAGSGITPILSIAASLLVDERSHVTVLYGNRRTDTVMFLDELADLKDRYPSRFQLVHVLSREQRDAELFSGRMDADRLARLLRTLLPVHDVDHWWLCGPHGMVEDARALLKANGVPIERIHRELFYVEDEPPPEVEHADVELEGDVAEATIILDGRTTTMSLPVDMPILDAAQQVRSDLPFACKGGVCGTCRALLRDGDVRMRRNFALDEDELAQGFVLTCQSLPASEQVTVDYDA
jgi:ferredoxin-NADP reductase/lipopolysaccharide export system protein LptA